MGIGGSSLGGKTLVALKDQGFGPATGRPKLWFMDNVDPATFAELRARLPLDRTGFIPISKSGGTPETLAPARSRVLEGKLGKAALANNVIAITEATDNPLRRLATRLGCPILDHDPRVGGRYSALSLVGMLPAMIAGVDCAAVREGAASVLDPVLAANDAKALAPAIGAALSVGLSQRAGHQHDGADALRRSARELRLLVPPALGREPRQAGQRHDADPRARHGRPAQPGPALSRRAAPTSCSPC